MIHAASLLTSKSLPNLLLRKSSRLLQSRLASTLVVAEPCSSSSFAAATLSAITAATKLSDGPITVMIPSGPDGVDVPSVPSPVTKVIVAKSKNSPYLAENVSEAVKLAQSSHNFTYIVSSATKFGGNFTPRAAALLGVSPVTDVIEILGDDQFVRPMYAGNALAKVKAGAPSNSNALLLTVRPTAFERAEEGSVSLR